MNNYNGQMKIKMLQKVKLKLKNNNLIILFHNYFKNNKMKNKRKKDKHNNKKHNNKHNNSNNNTNNSKNQLIIKQKIQIDF